MSVMAMEKELLLRQECKHKIGKIAKLLKEEKTESTPLQKKLGELGKLLGIITLSICLFLFFIAIIQKRNTIQC